MSYRSLLVLKAVACSLATPLLLLMPEHFFSWIGVTLGPGGAFPAREYGAALAGTTLLTWYAKDLRASDARRAILIYLFVYDAAGALATLAALLARSINPLAWGIFLVYAFFSAASAWVLRQEAQPAPG